MRVVSYTAAEPFLEAAGPLLRADSPRHQLILSVAETVRDQPDVYPEYHAWAVFDGDAPVAAASCTVPYKYIVADASTDESLRVLAQAVAGSGVPAPGAVGNRPTIDGFAQHWRDVTGQETPESMGQGVFGLTDVADLELAGGSLREAEPDDRHLILEWWIDFLNEAASEETTPRRLVEDRVNERLDPGRPQGLSLWEMDDAVVSMSGYSAPVANSIRIGPVYTPPDLRGNGYATALVATQSRAFLAAGRDQCLLYTDLANPTSNAIYRRIGYRQIAESMVYSFSESGMPG